MRSMLPAWTNAVAVVLAVPLAAQTTGAAQSTSHRIRVGARERRYEVDLPPQYDGRTPLPLVLDFHGGGGSPGGARTQTGFSTLGARVGAIVVYPAGSGRLGTRRLLTWNDETCCAYAQRAHVDDRGFVRALLDTLVASYAIDTTRIFATGISNGGMMAYLVGCDDADRVAAIAVVSGELTIDCHPTRPVAVLIIHGTADENLPYNGGVGSKALARHQVRPVSYAVNTWRALDGCPDSAATTTAGVVTHSVWAPCARGTAVELYTIEGGGHAWPGGRRMASFLDEPSGALNATEVAWAFFTAHARR